RMVRGLFDADELLTASVELLLDGDDIAVGVELRERPVQQVARLVGRVTLHEVRGHVVCRPERRSQRVGPAGREGGDLLERYERVPQDDHVADGVDAAPSGASGKLGVLTRGQQLMVLTREFRELLYDNGARRHVDTE